jgi:hypothetical protein
MLGDVLSAEKRNGGGSLLVLLEKIAKWLFLLSLVTLAVSGWHRDRLPDPGFYTPAIEDEPRQVPTDAMEFNARAADQRYSVKPLFAYELDGVVVSMHHAGSWIDIYHDDWQDYLNLKDICVIWGDNVRSGVYRDMDFENTTWTCWASWPNRAVARRFSNDQLSNNHLLADRPSVQQAILAARPGDQVRLRGYLAEYRNPANGFERGTSTTRTDRGNGACETVFVDRFHVVRQANPGWRSLFELSKWLAPLSGIAFLVLLGFTPVQRRYH